MEYSSYTHSDHHFIVKNIFKKTLKLQNNRDKYKEMKNDYNLSNTGRN